MAEGWSKLLQLPPLDAVTRSTTTSNLPARTLGLKKNYVGHRCMGRAST